jgi:hypothetical protein
MGGRRISIEWLISRNPWGRMTITGNAPGKRRCVLATCSCDGKQGTFDLAEITRREGARRSCKCLRYEAWDGLVSIDFPSLHSSAHFPLWDAAQAKTCKRRHLGKQFKVPDRYVGAVLRSVGRKVEEFRELCAIDSWNDLAFRARVAMGQEGIMEFGCNDKPRLKADKEFKRRIIDKAFDLHKRHRGMQVFTSKPVRSLWDLVLWVCQTYRFSREQRMSRRAEGSGRAKPEQPSAPRRAKTGQQISWEKVQILLNLARPPRRDRRSSE